MPSISPWGRPGDGSTNLPIHTGPDRTGGPGGHVAFSPPPPSLSPLPGRRPATTPCFLCRPGPDGNLDTTAAAVSRLVQGELSGNTGDGTCGARVPGCNMHIASPPCSPEPCIPQGRPEYTAVFPWTPRQVGKIFRCPYPHVRACVRARMRARLRARAYAPHAVVYVLVPYKERAR